MAFSPAGGAVNWPSTAPSVLASAQDAIETGAFGPGDAVPEPIPRIVL